VDGPTAKVHDQIRGRKGAFKLTLRTLDRILANRGRKTRVRVNTVVHRGNVQAIGEIPNLWRERPLDGWLLIPIDPKSGGEGALSRQDIETYNVRTAPILAETVNIEGFDPYVFGRTKKDVDYTARGQWARGYYEQHRCHVPDFHTLINSRGDVFPCCMTHQNIAPLGNIRDRPIEAIFRGKSYERLRLKMAAQRLAVCHRCDDFSVENRAINDLFDGWKKG
jgi:radical SAM protein with 4Fe4S-binding SPASM domain